jgi:hypothetical protein
MATDVRTKRIYDPAEPDDGYRVLIDHIWPRGVSRKRAVALEHLARSGDAAHREERGVRGAERGGRIGQALPVRKFARSGHA